MINYQYSFFPNVEIEYLNGILANIVSVIINSIVSSTIILGLEYAIKYIRKNAVQLLTTILFLHTVCCMKLIIFYNRFCKPSTAGVYD